MYFIFLLEFCWHFEFSILQFLLYFESFWLSILLKFGSFFIYILLGYKYKYHIIYFSLAFIQQDANLLQTY